MKRITGDDIALLNQGINEHLALREEMLAVAESHECWLDASAAELGKAGITEEARLKGVMVRTDDKTAVSFNAAIIGGMRTIPGELRKTLTVDNGSEMANFKELEEAMSLTTYFCDPHSPWQRGSNENCNGLLRQYFPRGTNFRSVKDDAVNRAVNLLNNRPRKCLNYQTPAEVLASALNGAFAT